MWLLIVAAASLAVGYAVRARWALWVTAALWVALFLSVAILTYGILPGVLLRETDSAITITSVVFASLTLTAIGVELRKRERARFERSPLLPLLVLISLLVLTTITFVIGVLWENG